MKRKEMEMVLSEIEQHEKAISEMQNDLTERISVAQGIIGAIGMEVESLKDAIKRLGEYL